jgi:hypothetical protein
MKCVSGVQAGCSAKAHSHRTEHYRTPRDRGALKKIDVVEGMRIEIEEVLSLLFWNFAHPDDL